MTTPALDLNVAKDVTSLRMLVESRLREAIAVGRFRPGQRLVERELCELTGVGRTSIREALRQLEAEGLLTTIPHRGPVVSSMTVDEAEQLYAVRMLLEGFAGRECARRRDPQILARLRAQVERMRMAAQDGDRRELLAAKTEFYAALLDGCGNVFIHRFLNLLLNRVTLLRTTSMTQKGRIKHTLAEMADIVAAIAAGDEEAAERACIVHVRNAAAVAREVLRADPAAIAPVKAAHRTKTRKVASRAPARSGLARSRQSKNKGR